MVDIDKLKGLTQDSRNVEEGYLFAAFAGETVDGRDYIAAAIEKGASHILAPTGTPKIEGVELIFDDNPRRKFAGLAARFYEKQPDLIAAVTGTNGKTSVVSFLEQLWQSAGYQAASLGTLSGKMTTLDTVALHEALKDKAENRITHIAMEASSHGLDQCRLHGAKVKVAGFTNLSRDHLDYHGDMAAYLEAKQKLFTEVLEEGGVAVLNADVPEFPALKSACEARGVKVIEYGRNGQHIRLIESSPLSHGQTLALGVMGNPYVIDLPLVGEFQTMNILCALGMAIAHDPQKTENYIEALSNIKGAAGRIQSVSGHPSGAGVFVDYAHTPDALENVLNALRPHTQGKLVCVFGCGGDRDKGKRPEMGKIASDLADTAIVTDDNPRSEDPAQIRAEIMSACKNGKEIGDRAEAIGAAIAGLKAGDVLVIAGKGHEQGQIFASRTEPFDDVQRAIQSIKDLHNRGKK